MKKKTHHNNHRDNNDYSSTNGRDYNRSYYKRDDRKNYSSSNNMTNLSGDYIPDSGTNFYAKTPSRPVEIYDVDPTHPSGWYPVSGGGSFLLFPWYRNSWSVINFVYVNLTGKSNSDIISQYDRYHQRLYDAWGADYFRFRRRIITPTIATQAPDISTMTTGAFRSSAYALNIIQQIQSLEANRSLGDIYVVLLPDNQGHFSNGATATTTSVRDPKKSNGWFAITYFGAESTPEVFAHEFGHAMFQRKYTDNSIDAINPYDQSEWNTVSDKAGANADSGHSYLPNNVMRSSNFPTDIQTTTIQKAKAFWSPLGLFRDKS